jgi:hypothetical protein
MARPRKARLEGAAAKPRLLRVDSELRRDEVVKAINEPRKVSNPVPGDDGEALSRIVASFRERFPDEWAKWAKCPLESGLPAMAELMKGKG